jgi:hypothetical protein
MPVKATWPKADDEAIIAGCKAGDTWAVIAQRLNINRNRVIERARKLGVFDRAALIETIPKLNTTFAISETKNRAPLEAGHPVTWGLISNGYAYPKGIIK